MSGALLKPRNNMSRLTADQRRQLQHIVAHHGGWVGAARLLGVSVSTLMALEAEYGSAQVLAVARCVAGLDKAR